MFYSHKAMKEIFYDRCRGWELKFAFLPKQCFRSGKKIWLKYGYRGIALWTGPGDPMPETQWHDKDEHLIWLLGK
jgi:hypothetical protein